MLKIELGKDLNNHVITQDGVLLEGIKSVTIRTSVDKFRPEVEIVTYEDTTLKADCCEVSMSAVKLNVVTS